MRLCNIMKSKSLIFLNRKEDNMHKKGFTLAEVLITLGIIGVVAALTMPTVLNKTKNAELVSSYKKVYAELSQVYMTIKADNGGTFEGLCQTSDDYYELFKKYMKNVRTCEAGTVSGKCWAKDWYVGGNKIQSNENESSSLILPNGTSILFFFQSSSCTSSNEVYKPISCARMRVDLNGLKKPNSVGRDIFDFYITQEGLLARCAKIPNIDIKSAWCRGLYILQKGKMN